VDAVHALANDTKCHLRDTIDHCQLHLEGIQESKFVLAHVPLGVHTEWIHAVRAQCGFMLTIGVAGTKQIEGHCHHVIVDETTVGGEETHQQQHVTHFQQQKQLTVVL
jgi:hypothetical protein